MTVEQFIIYICLVAVSFAVSIAYSIFTRIKSKRVETANKVLNDEAKRNAVLAKVSDHINKAEQLFGAGNGTAKKMFALSNAKMDALVANVVIDEDIISQEIEKILTTPQAKKKEQ